MEAQNGSESVCVAVHVRPLIGEELEQGCRPCLAVVPGEPQVRQQGATQRPSPSKGDP